jgi:hypothetical protein
MTPPEHKPRGRNVRDWAAGILVLTAAIALAFMLAQVASTLMLLGVTSQSWAQLQHGVYWCPHLLAYAIIAGGAGLLLADRKR